ncbi:FtsX-like permease family protein [Marinobacter halodurans]|uniref:FtsX-like permease family protein n=1 Tax=Marinobacter halodurans TaxID=2528979 RepID=A0ABY1ZQ54_9GAMM|nr:ABC transporter permease [Marinobacter halodurans]TBW57915.1 FtsX-like permease family protein [Marinobacter halodurans]
MTRRSLWLASASHYRRHPLQGGALLLIIILATALWSGVWDLTRQARQSLQQGTGMLEGLQEIRREDGAALTVADFVHLRRSGVCVLPWLESTPPTGQGRVIGIDPLSLGCFADAGMPRLSQRLQDGPFEDIGKVIDQAPAPTAVAGLRLMAPSALDSLPAGYRAVPAEPRLATGELADSFLLNLDALCILVLLITGLLVRSVYLLGLSQRRAGTLLLIRFGVTPARLRGLRLVELVVVSLLGAVPGTLLGLLMAQLFAQGFARVMSGLFDVTLVADAVSWMACLPVPVMIGLVLVWCWFDRPEGEGRHRLGSCRWGCAAAVLLLGVAGLLLADTLVLVFLALALVFLGVGLLTPALLSRGLDRAAGSTSRPMRQWSLRELSVMIRRLGLPVVALQFAAATVIAIQALVSTFEATFYQWLDQRLQGDVYLEIRDTAERSALTDALGRLDLVDHWYTVQRDRAELIQPQTQSVDLLALPSDSLLLHHWSFLGAAADPWARLSEGQVMVNEQLARRLELETGDRLCYRIAGQDVSATVAAVYADYGRPSGELLVAESSLPAGFRAGFTSITVELADGASPEALGAALARTLPDMALDQRDTASVRELATRIFEQTFLLTRAISMLTLVLAAVSLLVLGWVFFGTRRWYFHLLRVWGIGRRELRGRISGLSVSVTLMACLAALPLGILLTWVLVARINPLAFGWSLPMAIYPLFWLQLVVVAGVIGLAIAWLIQRRLGERPPEPVTVGQLQGAER